MRTCTRRLEFDAAHRVARHESKCVNLHGHRYAVELTCDAAKLDDLGRVIDFSVIKAKVGAWIDERWDHGALLSEEDGELIAFCQAQGWRVYTMKQNPTAENIAAELWHVATRLLAPEDVFLAKVRVYETPNCWAEYP
jgi:6-pyruvoyltetrahydropterin/6-carboxytetrahydropterin synthase